MQPPREGRQRAVEDILKWQAERDAFWTYVQVRASRKAWLENLSDDDLRAEWRKYRPAK